MEVIVEEVFESGVALSNVAHMQARPAPADRREVDLRRLVAEFLRMSPDIAIVGEVMDWEALRGFGYRRSAWSGLPFRDEVAVA